ncbi:MAG: CapA family protein [bacterium]|nr:CapA family protein [bacterium]
MSDYLLSLAAVLTVGAFFGFILFKTGSFTIDIVSSKLNPLPALIPTEESVVAEHKKFPVLSRKVIVDKDLLNYKLTLKAKAFVVKDLDTGEGVLQQNGDTKFPIASVTKLVTAMVALDNIPPEEIVKVSKSAINTYGRQGGLSTGEKFRVVDLINCLLLESSNDAAEALAEHFGRAEFLALMNKKVASLGMKDTSYKDPSGLSSSNVSTSEDLSRLITHIEHNRSDILAITKKKSYEVPASKLSKKHVWYNINRLVRNNDSYYLGGKDGFTGEALMTFTGAFSIPINEFDHKRFSIAILRSSDRNSDVAKIIDRVSKSLKYENGLSAVAAVNKNNKTKIEPDKNLALLFAGDIRIGQLDPPPFESVPFLKDADITFGSIKGPISDLGYDIGNKDSVRMAPEVIPALVEAGFDALSVAGGHIGDWGITALEDTLKRLRTHGIVYVGGGFNVNDARTVKIIEKNGIKIGFLGFSDMGPEWLEDKKDLPTILSASDAEIKEVISDAAQQVDHLIVSFDFGKQDKSESSERQRFLAHRAVDLGARIVIGHDTHLVQDVERYNDGMIAYGLGDLTSGNFLGVILDKKMILEVREDGV